MQNGFNNTGGGVRKYARKVAHVAHPFIVLVFSFDSIGNRGNAIYKK